MRRYKPTYFIKEGFKGLWRNGVMSLASVTVLLSCLVVMGCFALLVLNINYNLSDIGDLNVIKLFVDGGSSHAEGETVILPDKAEAEDPNVKLLGWARTHNAAEPEFLPGAEYTVSAEDAVVGEIKLYAVWDNVDKPDGLIVKYNASGLALDGALPVDEQVYQQGEEITIAPALAARYSTITFLGWALTPGATESQYAPGSKFYPDAIDMDKKVLTFYAVWSQMPAFSSYSLVYDMNRVAVKGGELTDENVRLTRIENQIKALDNVASVEHTTPAEVMDQMYQKFVDAGYTDLAEAVRTGENPYRHEFSVVYSDNSAVSTLEFQLQHIEGVGKVNCRTDYADRIESLKSGIIIVFAWFMVILFIVSLFVIMNTVKLAVYSRRSEISIMRYVGATNFFIAAPFVVEGVIIGLVSSGIAYGIQYYMYKYVQKMVLTDINMVSLLNFSDIWYYFLAGFLIIGIFTGVIGSLMSMRKYLKA